MKMHPDDLHPLHVHNALRFDPSCHDLWRKEAKARSSGPQSRGSFRWFSRAKALSGAIVVLAGTVLLPVVCAAQDDVGSPESPAAVAANWSPEGRQMLLVLLLLAGAFIAFERYCAWRLAVGRRQTAPSSVSTHTSSASPSVPEGTLPTAF